MRKILMTLAGAALLILVPGPNANAMWTHWQQGPGVYRYTQNFTVQRVGRDTFWASQFNFVENPAGGGYVGVQNNGYAFSFGNTDMAIFSLWDAIRAEPGEGAVCGAFGGEGEGLSCRAPISLQDGSRFMVRVHQVGPNSKTDNTTEYGASVINLDTNERRFLGKITVKGEVNMTAPNNFIEYFGPEKECMERPLAIATFNAPGVSYVNDKRLVVLKNIGTSIPSCSKEQASSGRLRITISTGSLETDN